jgi:hypothetical protein
MISATHAHQHDLQREVQSPGHPAQGRVLELDADRKHPPFSFIGLLQQSRITQAKPRIQGLPKRLPRHYVNLV